MHRRDFIRASGVAVTASIAGCGTDRSNEKPDPKLEITVQVDEAGSGWETSIKTTVSLSALHDVALLAFDDTGTEIDRTELGDFEPPGIPSSDWKTTTATFDRFPAIVTATAEESPCDGARIGIVYWTGDENQRGKDLPPEVAGRVWNRTHRRCDEALPPRRVVEQLEGSESTDVDG